MLKKLVIIMAFVSILLATSIYVYAATTNSETNELNKIKVNTSKFLISETTNFSGASNYLKYNTSATSFTFNLENLATDNDNTVDIVMDLSDIGTFSNSFRVSSNGVYYATEELQSVFPDDIDHQNIYQGIATYTNIEDYSSNSSYITASKGNVLLTNVSLDLLESGVTVELSTASKPTFYVIEYRPYNRYVKNENDLLALNSIKGHNATDEDIIINSEDFVTFTKIPESGSSSVTYEKIKEVSDETLGTYDVDSPYYYRNYYKLNTKGDYFWGDSYGSGSQFNFETNEDSVYLLDRIETFEDDLSVLGVPNAVSGQHFNYYEKTYVQRDIIASFNYNEIYFLDDINITEDNAELVEGSDPASYITYINFGCSFHLLDNNLILYSTLGIYEYYSYNISLDSSDGNIVDQIIDNGGDLTLYAPEANIITVDGVVIDSTATSIPLISNSVIKQFTTVDLLTDIEDSITRTIPINATIVNKNSTDDDVRSDFSIVKDDVIFSKHFYNYDVTIDYSVFNSILNTSNGLYEKSGDASEELALSPTGKVKASNVNQKLILEYSIVLKLKTIIKDEFGDAVLDTDGNFTYEESEKTLTNTRNILVVAEVDDSNTDTEKEASYTDIVYAYSLELEYFVSSNYDSSDTVDYPNGFLAYSLGIGTNSNVLSIAHNYPYEFILSSNDVEIVSTEDYFTISNTINKEKLDGSIITVSLSYDESGVQKIVTSDFKAYIKSITDAQKLLNIKDQIYSILLSKDLPSNTITKSDNFLNYAYTLPNQSNIIFSEYDVSDVSYRFVYKEADSDIDTPVEIENSYSSVVDKTTAEYRFFRWVNGDLIDPDDNGVYETDYDYLVLFDNLRIPSNSTLYIEYTIVLDGVAQTFYVVAAIPEKGLGGTSSVEYINQLFKEYFEEHSSVISLTEDDSKLSTKDPNIYFSIGIYYPSMIENIDVSEYFSVPSTIGTSAKLTINTDNIPLEDTTIWVRVSISDNISNIDPNPYAAQEDDTVDPTYEDTYQLYSFVIPGIIRRVKNVSDTSIPAITDTNLYQFLIEQGFDSITDVNSGIEYLTSSAQEQKVDDGTLDLKAYNDANPSSLIGSIEGLYLLKGIDKFVLSGIDLSSDAYKYLFVNDLSDDDKINDTIKSITMEGSSLSEIDLSNLQALKTLHVSSNSLTEAPKLFRSVTDIDLSNNQITTISNVANYVGATTIDLSNNNIVSFADLLPLGSIDLGKVVIYGNSVLSTSIYNSNSIYYGTPSYDTTTGTVSAGYVNFPVVVTLTDLGVSVYNDGPGENDIFIMDLTDFDDTKIRDLHEAAVSINDIIYFKTVVTSTELPQITSNTTVGASSTTFGTVTIDKIYNASTNSEISSPLTYVDSTTDPNYHIITLTGGTDYVIVIKLEVNGIFVYRELFITFE